MKKNKFNNLLKYIYEYSEKPQRKETINGLFRAILEPLLQHQKVEACAFLRIFDTKGKESVLKRLAFSGVKLYNFAENEPETGLKNCEIENIWDKTEFLVILGERYSAALIWDYSDSEIKDSSRFCLLYNSSIIHVIAKLISENSKEDFKDLLKQYVPDRRANMLMNKSIQTIAYLYNDKNEELIFSEQEKNCIENDETVLKTAQTVAEKAKFIAHEIKNNLSIINLYSKIAGKRFEELTGEKETVDSAENALKIITNASANISYLISDLRCMSNPYKTDVEIKKLVENVIEMCRQKTDENGVKLVYKHISGDMVHTDKVKAECAITNIIFNAIDAKAKKIVIETRENKIRIINDGEEIAQNIKAQIFEENFTTKERGNGLGLAYCKREMELAGGGINLVSSDKNETVFEINL